MRRYKKVLTALCTLTLAAVGTCASAEPAWDGFYAGLNAGEARNSTCNNWSLNGAISDPAVLAAFSNRSCPSNSSSLFGFQFGYNFQSERLFWGLGADYDIWGSKNQNRTLNYTGLVPPPGRYVFSGTLNPNGFGVFGPRIGYAGEHWLPYLRAGGVITGGSHHSTLTYTPAGTNVSTASFSGGKNFTSTGWAAGGGAEFVLSGPWSIKAEYLHATLGKGSNSTTNCVGSPTACATFAGISLDSTHNSFTADIFRIGFNYWFAY